MQAELSGLALALAPNEACYVPLNHKQAGDSAGLFAAGLAPDQIAVRDALDLLKPVLESAGLQKIGFNVKFTAVLLAQHGIVMQNHDDVELISYALDAGRGAHDLESLAQRWLGHPALNYGELIGSGRNRLTFDQVTIDRATAYAAEYADLTLRLWQVLKPRLVAERMNSVYETLERPMIATLARMERRGITIDRQVLSRLSGEFAQTAARLEAEIQELAGEPINVGSPKQIGDIMFGKMGLPGGSKTKTGAWSTSAQILDDLAEQGHEFPRKILDWRQVSKLKAGAEALDMMQAMNTGHDGSMTTCHANSARDAFARLETMVMMASSSIPDKVVRQMLTSAIHIVIQVSRLNDGSRKILSISEVADVEDEHVNMEDIFVYERTGMSQRGKALVCSAERAIGRAAWTG